MIDTGLEVATTALLFFLVGAALVMVVESAAFMFQGRLREGLATALVAMGYGTMVIRVGNLVFHHDFAQIPWEPLASLLFLAIGTVTLGYFSINQRRRDKLGATNPRRWTDREPWE